MHILDAFNLSMDHFVLFKNTMMRTFRNAKLLSH